MIRGAIRWQQLSHRLFIKRIPLLPGIIHKWICFRYNSDLAPCTTIGEGTSLGHGGIGVVINPEAIVGCHCIFAQHVTLAKHKGGAPFIDDCVYIGHGSIVMGGVKVGKNAFVGALSLVNKDVPDNAIVAGIPAKVLRIQDEEEIKEHPCYRYIKISLDK